MQPVNKSVIYLAGCHFVNDGRYGNVYETGYRLRFDSAPLAYKEYKSPAADGKTAHKAVVFRDVLPTNRTGRDVLDKYFAWPREMVIDDATRRLCGFLMPLAGKDFFWETGTVSGNLRTLDWLAAPETNCQLAGVDQYMSEVTQTDRLFLMTELTGAVSWLHQYGWVFGDFSFANAAFAKNPVRLMIFDCDEAAELADQQRTPQPHTLHWFPPECLGIQPQRQQDQKTDVYKLALAVIRCLKPELRATTTLDVTRLTGILDAAGIAMLTRALSPTPGKRPGAQDLFQYLEGVTRPLMVPPVIAHADLVTPLVMRGANAQILWHIERAQEIQVFVGDPPALVRRGKPADYPGGCVFPVTLPGQVTVVAENPYGKTPQVIGNVAPFEIPPLVLDLSNLSQPAIPGVPDFAAKPFPPRPAALRRRPTSRRCPDFHSVSCPEGSRPAGRSRRPERISIRCSTGHGP